MSAAGRLAISKATKARWTKVRELKATAAKAPKRKISAAGRARIAKAQKARWAKVRAAEGQEGRLDTTAPPKRSMPPPSHLY